MKRAETLVTVPQDSELEGITGAFAAAGHSGMRINVGRQACQRFEELGMLVAVCGHGKAQHALRTQRLIDQPATVRAVICAGATGGLDPALKVDDVVVSVTTRRARLHLAFSSSARCRATGRTPISCAS